MLDLLPRDHWQYSIGDLFHALIALLKTRRAGEPILLPELDDCVPAGSGRAALLIALKALDLPSGAKVGVPLYCCSIVFRAIIRAGYEPRFIDVDPKTFCMSAEDLSSKCMDLDAVIAVHMFGNMCDMPRLQAAAPHIPFIEDCALSLGSKLAGKIAGSFGAISIFSFRSGKYISVGEGGALFSARVNVRSRARELIASSPQPTLLEELLHVAGTYIKSLLRSKPLYGMIGHRLWVSANKKLKLAANSDIHLRQVYKSDFALAKSRLPQLSATIEAHRANANSYSTNLALDSGMVCSERSGFFYNRLQYPIIFPSQEIRDLVAACLLEKGIDTIKYLDEIVEIAAKSYGYTGTCPVSERLSKRVLLLPNYGELRHGDVQYIIQHLNAIWGQVGGNGCGSPGVLSSREPVNKGDNSDDKRSVSSLSGRQCDRTLRQEMA